MKQFLFLMNVGMIIPWAFLMMPFGLVAQLAGLAIQLLCGLLYFTNKQRP